MHGFILMEAFSCHRFLCGGRKCIQVFWFPIRSTCHSTDMRFSYSGRLSRSLQLVSDALLPHWVSSSGDFIVGRGAAGRALVLLKAGARIDVCWLTFHQALGWASVSVSFSLYTVELPQQDQCQAESCVHVSLWSVSKEITACIPWLSHCTVPCMSVFKLLCMTFGT